MEILAIVGGLYACLKWFWLEEELKEEREFKVVKKASDLK